MISKVIDFFKIEHPKFFELEEDRFYSNNELIEILKTKRLTLATGNAIVLSILERINDSLEK